MGASDYVHLEVELIADESEHALLLIIDGEGHWFPRSTIADGNDYARGDQDVTVSVREWIARKKGLCE